MSYQRPPILSEVWQASARIRQYVFRSPLRRANGVAGSNGAEVFLKLENWQPTGSFKVRGAINLLSQLSSEELARGIVTASAGNHGLAVGYAAQLFNAPAVTVFVPQTTPRTKVRKLRRFPITVREVGETFEDAHHAAVEYQLATGATFVHAYDDVRTVAGAGTIGIEIIEDLADVNAVLVPVGGGGLISGIATAVKGIDPRIRVYGVQPDASPALRDSLRDGVCYEEYAAGPTICEGLAGGIGQIVFEVGRKGLIDDVLIVPEAAVRQAVAELTSDEQLIVEGSGAVGLAALDLIETELRGRRVVLILTGANIDASRLAEILVESQ